MILILLKDFFICIAAVVFYSMLMNLPKNLIVYASVISGIGYVIYDLLKHFAENEIFGYFIATLVIAVFGEAMARIKKTPSTLFVFPAIIPLVPGIGLYQTMLHLVRNEYEAAVSQGVQTVFIAGAMAVSIAIINVLARFIFPRKHKL
jgi:Uncharacterized conserved protein